MTSFQYLHNFAPTLDNFSKKFSMETKFGYFTVHFKENLSTNFGLIVVFVKVALEITKRTQHCVLLIHMFSCFFEIAPVYSRLAGCRVYKGHLQNEWVIKTFRKPPKGGKFVCIRSCLQFMYKACIIYTLLVEIPRYLEIPRIDFCETSHNRRQAPKVYVA